MRYFIEFAYNGTLFHGSQSQPNASTVQESMEKAFSTILRQPIALTFAGRTDAGVHAEQMMAHFDIEEEHLQANRLVDLPMLTARLNSLLPPSITTYNLYPVAADMHARFSATARTYEYRITTLKDPFRQTLLTRVAPGLDFEAMNQAAHYLLGKQDFSSFCKVHTDVKTTFCTITQAQWLPIDTPTCLSSFDSTTRIFRITADRFLRNMVRAIVGTLFEVGYHHISIDDFRTIISEHNRCAAGQSAPASGLYLTHIEYPM